MAEYTFGEGADALVLRFTADAFGEAARINAGVLENGAIIGAAAEYVPIEAARGSEGDTVTIRGEFPADAAFYVSFLNDNFIEGEGDRNVQLVGAEINGVAVEGAAAELFSDGDYGPFYFDGDAAAPAPEPEPEPVPGVVVRGTASADALYGGEGPDTISGLAGDDVLAGKGGDDVLNGGAGSDVFTGGAGDDLITTNGGRDTVVYTPGDGRDAVTDFDPDADSIWFGGGTVIADVAFADAERDGAAGALVTFAGDPDSEVWLPGVSASELGFVTILA